MRDLWWMSVALLMLVGCSSGGKGPYTAAEGGARNPIEAQRLTQVAVRVMGTSPERAERLLREALDADLFCGPAHNNLGVLLLARGELHPAAQEFEWARKLLPEHPDPRLNLAMTLEQAGRIDDAVGEYRAAAAVNPSHVETLQALCRCRLRHDSSEARRDPTLWGDLRTIATRGSSAEWREWAQRQHAILAN